jgi:hypothetical protein
MATDFIPKEGNSSMATRSQIEANRRNAAKSTGPKTPEGKFKSFPRMP